MEQFIKKERRIPVSTWSWLRVNDTEIKLYGSKEAIEDRISLPTGIYYSRNLDEFDFSEDPSAFFLSPDTIKFINENANYCHYIKIPKTYNGVEPIKINLYLDDQNPIITDDIIIEAEEDSNAAIILKYTSEKSVYHHCGRTRVIARKNSNIRIIKIQMMEDESTHMDSIGVFVEEGAYAQLLVGELGASKPISSCNIVLSGDESRADLDVLYLGHGSRNIDISTRVEHRGIKSISKTCVKGVLMDESKKILRDTLDFISGSRGSKGSEEESVLMLSPKVKNISVPILLCGEDDVEGEHAASSGKPDDKILFYLMSRGFSKIEAMKILAEAAFSSVIENIPDEELKDEILYTLRNIIMKGGI